jgi:hypothetical protein
MRSLEGEKKLTKDVAVSGKNRVLVARFERFVRTNDTLETFNTNEHYVPQ